MRWVLRARSGSEHCLKLSQTLQERWRRLPYEAAVS